LIFIIAGRLKFVALGFPRLSKSSTAFVGIDVIGM